MKSVIFGAGDYGRIALNKIGSENIDFYIDNNLQKQGTEYFNKKVISLEEFIPFASSYHVVVASTYAVDMIKQLEEHGISNYSIFSDYFEGYYKTEKLIFNPYEINAEALNEEEWNCSEELKNRMRIVYNEAELLYQNQGLFQHIEIETINRCNGTCSFCPVNRNVDSRKKMIMTEELFYSIINQLEELDYSGRFTTFSNNEPLLDDRIIEWNLYARKKLPKARMHLYTNGTLMTLDKFKSLVEILDELIIDNYQQELKLIKPCQQIQEYCKIYPELTKKVTIVLRKPQEILTSRGGTAPNRFNIGNYTKERCVLPFKQMIVRPDGKISLCCNDALGKYTLGDLTKEKIVDVWYGAKFQMVRKSLYEGRGNWGNCKFCDTFCV